MKRENPIRDAIDESLSGVHFDAGDERRVLRAIRAREDEPRTTTPPRRRFKPDFAFVLTLAVIVAAPLSLLAIRAQSARVITAAPGSVTASPRAVLETSVPRADPIVDAPLVPAVPVIPNATAAPAATAALAADEESAVILTARACFESLCDTSVFSFEEYTVGVSGVQLDDGTSLYTVTMNCIYDNGCRFTVQVAMPSGELVRHSTPELATAPTYFDSASAEVQSWYARFGAYPFTWGAAQQAEFSRRYEGAALREPADGEVAPEAAASIAAKAIADSELASGFTGGVYAYPMLRAERANADGRARYVVYCFAQEVTDALSDPCAVVTLRASDGAVERVEACSAAEVGANF